MELINIANLICPVLGVIYSALPTTLGKESLPHQQDEEEAIKTEKYIRYIWGFHRNIDFSHFSTQRFGKTSLHQGGTKHITVNLMAECGEM